MAHSETGLIELGPGIWAVIMSIIPPEGGGPNAGFIVTGNQVLVIDSLMSPSLGRRLSEHLRKVTDNVPTYLINTHDHGDHVFGNQVFSPPATIIAHENVRNVLLSQGRAMLKPYIDRYSSLVQDIEDTTVLPPQITYRNHMRLHLDGRTIELIHPGVAHTQGDTMVYLPEAKILFSGDILFNHIFPPIRGSSAGWIAAIELAEALDVDTIVPGHGFIATKRELGDLKGCLIELRSQVKNCFVQGLPVEQTIKEIDMPYLDWPRTERLGPDVEMIYEELIKEGAGR